MAMDLNAKAAYIRGLMTGMDFDADSKNGKVIAAMMDLLEEMAAQVTEHDNALDQVYDELETLDQDLDDVVSDIYADEDEDDEEDAEDAHFTTHSNRFVLGFLMLAFCVGLGSYVTTGLTKLCGFNFPAYIGPMLVAVAVRNLIDHTGRIEFPAAEISTMGNMFLAIFLSMALSGLKLWQLVDLALPMLVCLAAEVLLMVFFSILVLFPLMGRNYDAAMITAGFIGFGMGATSNAMANMQAVARRYGPSPSAYFMIPMVGGLFNDFFNAAIIALSIGLLS